MPKEQKSIKFNYYKTETYRSYYTDGVFGGITSKGKIYADFFIEKFTTPKSMQYEIIDDDKLGKEFERESAEGFSRQIECGVIMDVSFAKVLNRWLSEKIEEHEAIKKQIDDQ